MAVNGVGNGNLAAPAGGGADFGGVTNGEGGSSGLSSQKVCEILAKILEKKSSDFESKLKDAEGQDEKQGSTAMMKVQQAQGACSTTQTLATSLITGINDAQKESARASK